MYLLIAIILLILLSLLFYKFIFLRNPERKIPSGKNIVSPADGRVILIQKFSNKEIKINKGFVGKIKTLTSDIADKGYIVSIFMNLFNVHVNRSPINGKIISLKHTKGKFYNAADIEKSLLNEKNELIIENKELKIKVIQIAGLVARRIICFKKENEKINKGERIGIVKLGSQVTLILPKKINLKVKKGDNVKAGSSIIATY